LQNDPHGKSGISADARSENELIHKMPDDARSIIAVSVQSIKKTVPAVIRGFTANITLLFNHSLKKRYE
jgi:hypothetical protein